MAELPARVTDRRGDLRGFVAAMRSAIAQGRSAVIAEIKKSSQPIKDKEQVAFVATIAGLFCKVNDVLVLLLVLWQHRRFEEFFALRMHLGFFFCQRLNQFLLNSCGNFGLS